MVILYMLLTIACAFASGRNYTLGNKELAALFAICSVTNIVALVGYVLRNPVIF